jgi:hypothetical protein
MKLRKKIWVKTKFLSVFIAGLLLITSYFYSFPILADPPEDFSLKWICNTDLSSFIGPVTKDIDDDGIHEIFISG